jgi:predicted dehydrogenase
VIGVGVLGAGYWGPNLIRTFANLDGCELTAICEQDDARRERVSARYQSVPTFAAYDAMLSDPSVDAIVVATPVEGHYAHSLAALEAGKHLFVEKPLARTTDECSKLIDAAASRDLVLMAGHTFLYNAAVRNVKRMIEDGELGDILYIHSRRVNLGIVRRDINAMWNLAPHDLSIVGYLFGDDPTRVTARGLTYLQEGLPDVVFLTVDYPGGLAAHIHVSWLDPQKVRAMTIVGTKKMVVYDDMSLDAKVQVYDKGVDVVGRNDNDRPAPGFGEYQTVVRSGDLLVPQIDFEEPLRTECAHFVDCIANGSRPVSDGWDGLRVVAVLEAAERSMANDGAPVDVGLDAYRSLAGPTRPERPTDKARRP